MSVPHTVSQMPPIETMKFLFKDILKYTQHGNGVEIEEIAQRKRKKVGRPSKNHVKVEQKQNKIITRSQISDKQKLQNFKDWYIKNDEGVVFQKLLSKRNLPTFIKDMSETPEMLKKMTNCIGYI